MNSILRFSTLCLALALLLGLPLAESRAETLRSRCGGTFNLCGFVDTESGEQVIPFVFEKVRGLFSEGRAGVRINGRWGFIDETGRVVVPPIYDAVGRFKNGVAEVLAGGTPQPFFDGKLTALAGGKAGLIDRNGETIVEPAFGRVTQLTPTVFIATKPDPGARQRDPDIRAPFSEGGAGLFHNEDGWIVEPELTIRPFGNGLIWASKAGDDRRYGLMRADGTWVLEPRFGYAQSLSEDGLAVVAMTTDPAEPYRSGLSENVWGAVDAEGRIVIPLEREWLGYSHGGYFSTRSGRKQGLIDRKGQLLGGRYFDKIERPRDGKPARALLDGKWIGLTPDGDIIPDPLDGQVIGECPHVTITKHGDLYELRDRNGGLIGGKRSRYIGSEVTIRGNKTTHKFDCRKPLLFGTKGAMGFLLTDGTIMGRDFDAVQGFHDGHAIVREGKKWGIIDPTGKFTVRPVYDALYHHDGNYRAKLGGQTLWIDAAGAKIPKPQPSLEHRARVLNCWGGAKRFSIDGLWGLKDPDGAALVPPIHRAVSCFRNGVAWVPDENAKQWCPLGPDGTRPERPFCVSYYYPFRPTHTDPEKFDEDPFESNVLWMRARLDFAAGRIDEPPGWIGWKNAPSHSWISR